LNKVERVSTPIPVEHDAELRYAVSISYDLSCKRGLSLYDAWLTARDIAMEVMADLDELEAGQRAAMIIAWKALQSDAMVPLQTIAA
jgi:hypothetical protein